MVLGSPGKMLDLRVLSPPSGTSILITSAPRSAISMYGTVPACAVEHATTLTPASGPCAVSLIVLVRRGNAGVLDDLGPLGDVRLDDRRELGRRAGRRVEAHLPEFRAHVRLRQHLDRLLVQLVHDRRGRAGGRQQPEPGDRLEAGESGLRNGRKVTDVRRALE